MKRNKIKITEEKMNKFQTMHMVLTLYNEALAKGSNPTVPSYTDNEMSEYSAYRELLIAEKIKKLKL